MRVFIPWSKPEVGTALTIKWKISTTGYEISSPTLDSIQLHEVLPHCVDTRRKIEQVVSTPAHLGPSLFCVFSRTLSTLLGGVWDQIVQSDNNPPNTVVAFESCIRSFIEVHGSEGDQHDLLQQLRNGSKPRDMSVQSWWYERRRLNSYVQLLQGNEVALTDNEEKQAIFDGHPEKWRQRFHKQGQSLGTLTVAQLIRWLRKQENAAQESMALNNERQRQRAHDARRSSRPQGKGKD